MIAYLISNKNTAAERAMADLGERLKRELVEIEQVEADSPRGIQLCEDYDIMGRPAVALIRDDGSPVQVWQGEDSMPVAADVAYLAHQ